MRGKREDANQPVNHATEGNDADETYSIRPPIVGKTSGVFSVLTTSTVASMVAIAVSATPAPRFIPGQILSDIERTSQDYGTGTPAEYDSGSAYLRPTLKAQSFGSSSGLSPKNRSGRNVSGSEYSLSSREIALQSLVSGSLVVVG